MVQALRTLVPKSLNTSVHSTVELRLWNDHIRLYSELLKLIFFFQDEKEEPWMADFNVEDFM